MQVKSSVGDPTAKIFNMKGLVEMYWGKLCNPKRRRRHFKTNLRRKGGERTKPNKGSGSVMGGEGKLIDSQDAPVC